MCVSFSLVDETAFAEAKRTGVRTFVLLPKMARPAFFALNRCEAGLTVSYVNICLTSQGRKMNIALW